MGGILGVKRTDPSIVFDDKVDKDFSLLVMRYAEQRVPIALTIRNGPLLLMMLPRDAMLAVVAARCRALRDRVVSFSRGGRLLSHSQPVGLLLDEARLRVKAFLAAFHYLSIAFLFFTVTKMVIVMAMEWNIAKNAGEYCKTFS